MLASGDIWRRGRQGCLRGRRRKEGRKEKEEEEEEEEKEEEEEEEEEEEGRTAYIKSNNPYLTGGEKIKNIIYIYSLLLCFYFSFLLLSFAYSLVLLLWLIYFHMFLIFSFFEPGLYHLFGTKIIFDLKIIHG